MYQKVMKEFKMEVLRPRYRWGILFASFLAFVAFAFTFQTAPPLIPAIIEEFNISYAQAGLVMSIVLLPGIFLGLPAGIFAGKYGVRRVGFASLLLVVAGSLLTITANSFDMILAGRLILGIGGTAIITASSAAIVQWFPREELGKAMGIFGINMPFATAIAFPSSSVLMLTYGWRTPFYIGLIIGLAATAVYGLLIREGPFVRNQTTTSARHAIGNLEIWKVGLVWLFFNAAALSFTTWAPTLFEKFQNMSEVSASFLPTLLMWAAIFCVPLFGYLSDRTGKRKPFVISGALLMTLAFVSFAFTSSLTLVASILTLGITAAMIPPIVSALPAEILGPSLASIGFGITAIGLNIGATLAQPLIGFLIDSTGSYAPAFYGMAVLSLIGAITAYTLKTK
jgi:MFS family permease